MCIALFFVLFHSNWQNLHNNWQKLHNYVWKNMKKLLKGKVNNHVYKSNFSLSQLNTFYSCNLTVNLRVITSFMEVGI